MAKRIKRTGNRISSKEVLLERIQKLTEDELEQGILTPLFRALGYESVERHGGPDEHGMDLICWKKDELDENEVAAVQVKRFKPARRAASDRSFAGLLTQMCQACEEEIPHTNGQTYLPRTVYFVTPYLVDVRTLSTRFAKVTALRQQGVKIIDGGKLISLIEKHMPYIIRKLVGTSSDIQAAIVDHLNNNVLLNAVRSPGSHPIESIYTDIDFAVGDLNSRVFLLGEIGPGTVKEKFDESEWLHFGRLSALTQKVFGVPLATQSRRLIESMRKRSSQFTAWKEAQSRLQSLQRPYDSRKVGMEKLRHELLPLVLWWERKTKEKTNCKEIIDFASKISEVLSSPRKVNEYLISQRMTDDVSEPKEVHEPKETDELNDVDRLKHVFKRKSPDLRTKSRRICSLLDDLVEAAKRSLPLALEFERLIAHRTPPYVVEVGGEALCEALRTKRKWLLNELSGFRRHGCATEELKGFLEKSLTMLGCAREIFSERYILKAMLSEHFSKHIRDTESCRLRMSIHRIFDCELNTLVLGEAGAGKTTSLQMYTMLKAGTDDKVYLFLPLTSLVSGGGDETEFDQVDVKDRLVHYVTKYLSTRGCHLDIREMADLFKVGRVVLMLDGIDEVIVTTPWLIRSIVEFSDKYRATQVIASSRTSGDFIRSLPFVTVTLLPFSSRQRNSFIRAWFGPEDERGSAKKIIRHLERNRGMVEVVNNPLLATVMCTLQENGIPLPENEVRLYRARLDLLLRTYDVHKKAHRLKSSAEDLLDVAELIAYSCHTAHKREAELSEVYGIAETLTKGSNNWVKYRQAVYELLHPCNVLVPMTDDGKVGFGHLRYQEHLAANYLCIHRNVDLLPLAQDPWWRETFVFLSRMQADIEWLVAMLAADAFKHSRKTIYAIIATQPPDEQERLKEIVRSHRVWDHRDEIMFGNDF